MADKFINKDYLKEPVLPNQQAPTTANRVELDDYSSSFDPATIMRDPRFLNDLRQHMASLGKFFTNDSDMIDEFYSDQTFTLLNTYGAARDWYRTSQQDEVARLRSRRLENVYRNMPNFWEEGGRDWKDAIWDGGFAIITDPLNLVPGAAALRMGSHAARLAHMSGKVGRAAAVKTGAKAGAVSEAVISGVQEGITDVAHQGKDIALDFQDEYDPWRTAKSVGIGAAAGAGVGAAIGTGAGLIAGRQSRGILDKTPVLNRLIPDRASEKVEKL